MPRCRACSREVPEGSRFCPACGALTEPSSATPTRTSTRDDAGRTPATGAASPTSPLRYSSSDTPEDTRFLPGAVLAGRYRIVGFLGRGGMGEVYRADDLKLGQPVALKFLPESVQRDESRLTRLLNEVRVALRVTHPNVCRVHDLGEVEGQHYLSMEYIDGEDLSSLLRRIGHLPRDKAVELARQLCAGLVAAHEQGILHRDLKPANVMVDGRGRARITDFGLAGQAEGIGAGDLTAGTPAYMAPEQLDGKEVTVRSDLYSLGLVLYELFTGKRVFDARTPEELRRSRESSAPSPSTLIDGFDPAVERVILRCLETDPAARPASALAVAAALPGGDPLAAALAAGETPSPEMVADAGGLGGLRPGMALACAAVIVLSLALSIFLSGRFPDWFGLDRYVSLEKPPAVLVQDARDILVSLGHDETPVDTAYGFRVDILQLLHIEENDDAPDRWDRLRSDRPSPMFFWYRQSPRLLVPREWARDRVNQDDPRQVYSGEVNLDLDLRGRLRWLQVVPPQLDEAMDEPPEPDWSALFAAAGLEMAAFTEVPAVWTPPYHCDRRAAWTGSYPEDPETPLRIEAGAYRGRPVFFRSVDPWDRPWLMEEYDPGRAQRYWAVFAAVVVLAMMAGALLLARRNLRLGRGDRKGATRLALFVVVALMLSWAIGASHAPDVTVELGRLTMALGYSLAWGVLAWLAYLALEPFLRRRWPDTLISWNRLLAGRFRDPRIGRDLLVGVTAFWAWMIVATTGTLAPGWFGLPPPRPMWEGSLYDLVGGRYVAASLIDALLLSVLVTMGILFFLLLLRVILRKQWLAVIVMLLIAATPTAIFLGPAYLLVYWPLQLVFWSCFFLLLTRFGLLSVCAFWVCTGLMSGVVNYDVTEWYGIPSVVYLLAIFALAGYGFVTALAGRPLLREGVVPED